jgi:ankyrin repeat protein/predicted esterase
MKTKKYTLSVLSSLALLLLSADGRCDPLSALVKAIQDNDQTTLNRVEKLLSNSDDPIDLKSSTNSDLPLFEAIRKKNLAVVRLLLKYNASVNTKNREGRTPLHHAAQVGSLEIAELLLENHASVNARDDQGYTPLLEAASNRNLEVSKLLLQHKASTNIQSNSGLTLVHAAVILYDDKLLELLLKHHAQVDLKYLDVTPFQHATRRSQFRAAELLIAHGAKVNERDRQGRTGLHWAVEKGDVRFIKMLLENNALVNVKDDQGETPLHLAIKYGNLNAAELLVKNGANVNVENQSLLTPVQLAARLRQKDVLAALERIGIKADVNLQKRFQTRQKRILSLLAENGAIPDAGLLKKYRGLFQKRNYTPSKEAEDFASLYLAQGDVFRIQKQRREEKEASDPDSAQKYEELLRARNEVFGKILKLQVQTQGKNPDILAEEKELGGVPCVTFYRNPKKFPPRKDTPVLVYSHGEGPQNLITKSRITDAFLMYFLSQGYMVIAVNYRDGKEEDGTRVAANDIFKVGHAVKNAHEGELAPELDIDPSQIYLSGISYGSKMNFEMLTTLKRRPEGNPFRAVQLFTTDAKQSFSARVQDLPKDIPYLIVHGMEDDVAPSRNMQKVVENMKEEGFQVASYFSPTGDHDMVSGNRLTSKTPKDSELYKNFVKWPENMISFFSRLRRYPSSNSGSRMSAIEDGIIEKSLTLQDPRQRFVGAKESVEELAKRVESGAEFSPTIQYMLRVVDKSPSDKIPFNELLDSYFKKIQDFGPEDKDDLHGFAEKIIGNPAIYRQFLKALAVEIAHYQNRENCAESEKKKERISDKKGDEKNEPRSCYQNNLIAYHGTTGAISALYFLFNGFNSALKARQISLEKSRGEMDSAIAILGTQNPMESYLKSLKPKKPALNKIPEFTTNTISFAPTLTSGDDLHSNPLGLWFSSSTGGNEFNYSEKIGDYLASLCIPKDRIKDYQKLIRVYAEKNNGMLFQVFTSAEKFDQVSKLTEPRGVLLNDLTHDGKSLQPSTYLKLLMKSPEQLAKLFAEKKGTFKNALDWRIFDSEENADLLFTTAQIRTLAHRLDGMGISFYPHRVDEFKEFYNQLAGMIGHDVKVIANHPENACKVARQVDKSNWINPDCGVSENGLDPTLNRLTLPIREALDRVHAHSDVSELKAQIYQHILRHAPERLKNFLQENRDLLGPISLIRFPGRVGDPEQGIGIDEVIQREVRNPDQQKAFFEIVHEQAK